MANYITLEGATHDTFISYNGEEYVDLLTRELTAKRPEVYTKSTVVLGVDSGSKDGCWGCGDEDYDGWCEEDGEWFECGKEDDDGLSRGAIIGLSTGVAAIGIGVVLYFVLSN